MRCRVLRQEPGRSIEQPFQIQTNDDHRDALNWKELEYNLGPYQAF